jgi:hypothetical protein
MVGFRSPGKRSAPGEILKARIKMDSSFRWSDGELS